MASDFQLNHPVSDATAAIQLQTVGAPKFAVLGSGEVKVDDHATNHARAELGASMDPTTTDDSAAGFAVGSLWINTTNGDVFYCVDASAGAAVWQIVAGGGVAATPTYGQSLFSAVGTVFVSNVKNGNWQDVQGPWILNATNSQMSMPGPHGTLRYDGAATADFQITGIVAMESDSFAGVPVDLGIWVNGALGTYAPSSLYSAGLTENVSVQFATTLSTNDTVQLRWRRRAPTPGNRDFYVRTASLVVVDP